MSQLQLRRSEQDLLGSLNLLFSEVNTQLRTVGFVTAKIVMVVVGAGFVPFAQILSTVPKVGELLL